MNRAAPLPQDEPPRSASSLKSSRESFWIMLVGSAVGLVVGWFWISAAYSSQYNGTDANFSSTGGSGWFLGVVPVLFVGAAYHLALLPVGFKAYRTNGLLLVLIAAGVSAGLYAFQIIPTAMASGGPESFVP